MFPLFATYGKKTPGPKWTIYKHKSDKDKKCLSNGNFRILPSSSTVRQQPTPAYVEA